MSKATEQAALLGIHNDHEISRRFGRLHNNLESQMPFVRYNPANNGLAGHYAYWGIYRPGYHTGFGEGYPAYNTKTVTVRSREEREPMRLQAIAMCDRKYRLGGVEWKRSPFGGWHPAPVIDAFTAALKTAGQAAAERPAS